MTDWLTVIDTASSVCLQEIRDIAAAESRRDHSQCDAFVLFVMSHGCDGHVLGNDEKRVDILKEIADVVGKCSTLRNKPKMLFFQACRSMWLVQQPHVARKRKKLISVDEVV